MKHTLLGRTGLHVSSVALGAMTFGTKVGYGADEAASRSIFDLYAERGGNFIDTANIYNTGDSEEMVGRFLQGRRDRFVLASKYSVSLDATDLNSGGNGRKALMRSLDDSLRRLQTDHIDLYWVHVWDGMTPADEVLRALDDAVRQGKIGYVGISDHPAWLVSRMDALAEARNTIRPAAIQIEYNLAQRDADRELLPMAKQLGMGVLAWGPLAGGALTGKYLDGGEGRVSGGSAGHYTRYRDEHTGTVARAVVDAAREMGCSPGALATAWIIARSPLFVPILGARTAEQLDETLAATELDIPEAVLATLEEASAIPLGFPHEFLRDNRARFFGDGFATLDPRVAVATGRR